MTYEEARKDLFHLYANADCVDFADSETDALGIAIEALEKADRYRWHDLRKNPDDLPETGIECLAIDDFGNLCIGHMAVDGWLMTGRLIRRPIAWKYIEPFEVME